MKAKVHVEGYAYCEIKIENADMPPSLNIIDRISMYDGFGTFPTLELYLLDQSNTLQSDFGITDATKIDIKYAKEDAVAEERTFRVWSWKRIELQEGPMLKIISILDLPAWSTAAYTESFGEKTSYTVMSQLAANSGLYFEGDPTSDSMNWLNLCKTRNAFSEDVAMRGYASSQSCMARVVTLDKKLLYKDLMQAISKTKKTIILDMPEKDGDYMADEVNSQSRSSLIATWMNYGWTHHYHDLSGEQKEINSVNAPLLGDALPLNSEVKSSVNNKARISYHSYDVGTKPKPESNLHGNYEKAIYQNLRLLGLFTERLRVLVRFVCDIKTFDGVKYKQGKIVGDSVVMEEGISGNYLVSGKSVHIKHGHWYHEVYDLIRPYVNNGQKQMTNTASKKANDGSVSVPSERIPVKTPSSEFNKQYSPSNQTTRGQTEPTGIESAVGTMEALNDFNSLNPKVPTKTNNANYQEKVQNQNKLRTSMSGLKTSPLGNFDANVTNREIAESQTITKVPPQEVKSFLNED